MQVPVPQFIDVEDKIFGPFTLKQFGFIFGGGLLIAALFRIFQFGFVFFILSLPVAIITIGISFGRFNGRYIYNTFPIFISFFISPKIFIFHRQKASIDNVVISSAPAAGSSAKNEPKDLESPRSRLKKLSMLLDQKNQEELQTFKIQKQ